jgi:hypothetical protein
VFDYHSLKSHLSDKLFLNQDSYKSTCTIVKVVTSLLVALSDGFGGYKPISNLQLFVFDPSMCLTPK